MGLGKTLQTLSLFQHLKENRRQLSANMENRPCLVVCPLSVLSSWMAESRKWTPGLKVLRFHGSTQERDRLKKIATGEIDIYGNQTLTSRKKKNERRTATGKPIVDLDSDLEDVKEESGVDLVITTYEGFLAEQGMSLRPSLSNIISFWGAGHALRRSIPDAFKHASTSFIRSGRM